MYPVIRIAKELIRFRNAPPLRPGDVHETTLICWPFDIDIFLEMNNGRTLTLFDIGRITMFARMGFPKLMKAHRMAGTIAGSSVRYRRRVRAFQKITMKSRIVGWDARFTYAEQSMWRNGECTSHALLRMAVTDKGGIVPTDRLLQIIDAPPDLTLPDWAQRWAEADAHRPWPPMQD